jgi:hypothetical protein
MPQGSYSEPHDQLDIERQEGACCAGPWQFAIIRHTARRHTKHASQRYTCTLYLLHRQYLQHLFGRSRCWGYAPSDINTSDCAIPLINAHRRLLGQVKGPV